MSEPEPGAEEPAPVPSGWSVVERQAQHKPRLFVLAVTLLVAVALVVLGVWLALR